MKKNKGFGLIGILIVAIIVLVAGDVLYNAVKSPSSVPQNPIQNPISNPVGVPIPKTTTQAPAPVHVVISTTLPSPYISAQSGWPPVIQNSSVAYFCNVGQTSEVEKIVQKIINGRTYCIDTKSEGAAGSTYSTYTYTTTASGGNGTETTNFVLRYENCGVYGDSSNAQYIQCKTAQTGFNLDAIVDSLM